MNVHSQRVKQTQCPSTDEQINELWYIQTMENYSCIKRNEILIHTTWVAFENCALSERSQTLKATYCMMLFRQNV